MRDKFKRIWQLWPKNVISLIFERLYNFIFTLDYIKASEKKKVGKEKEAKKISEQIQLKEVEYNNCNIQAIDDGIQEITRELFEVDNKISEYKASKGEVWGKLGTIEMNIRSDTTELNRLKSDENRKLNILQSRSADAYNAVMWLRENKNKPFNDATKVNFKYPIHEPIMTLLKLKDFKVTFENLCVNINIVNLRTMTSLC